MRIMCERSAVTKIGGDRGSGRRLERWLDEWNGDSHQDRLQPYCQVVVHWLRKKLRRYVS